MNETKITCNDYGSRKGCGMEVYLVVDEKYSTPQKKKYKRCHRVKIPTFNDKGQMEYRWVEHSFFCQNADRLWEYTEKQLRKQAKFRASRNQENSGGVSRVGAQQPLVPQDDSDIPF